MFISIQNYIFKKDIIVAVEKCTFGDKKFYLAILLLNIEKPVEIHFDNKSTRDKYFNNIKNSLEVQSVTSS